MRTDPTASQGMSQTEPSIVQKINKDISLLKEKLLRIQEQCAHPTDAMSYKSGRIDDYGTESSYFRNCYCALCDKRWTEDV